jgi:two-component system, NarL family, nitrate/nitrite response regulator NarL
MVKRMQVLVVADQPRARQSLKALLATCSDVEEVQEAVNRTAALSQIEAHTPEVILLDVQTSECCDLDGVKLTRSIKTRWPQIRVIALSMYAEDRGEVLAAGADAFVCKGEPPETLLSAMAAVAVKEER